MEVRAAQESIEKLQTIHDQLLQNRAPYDLAWKSAAQYTNPNMADWNDEAPETSGKRPDDNSRVYDTTVQEASQKLADGIPQYAFPQGQPWWKLALEGYDELSDEESEWCEKAERRMYRQHARSNFYNEGRPFLKMGADFGTAIAMRQDNLQREVPIYKTQHIKRCLIAENEFGEVDVLFRTLWLTAFDAAEQFGINSLPERIKDAYRDKRLTKFKFIQAIVPPSRYDLDVSVSRPYYTVYWSDVERTKPVKEDGYNLKPFFVWRWWRNLDGDVWGIDSPGMMQFPTVKQLNSTRADYSRILQLTARPPIKHTPGLTGKIRITPNGMTAVPTGNDFTQALVTNRVEGVKEDIEDFRKQITRAYYNDFLLALSMNAERDKTATEVAGIQGEQSMLLSSFSGRLNSEFLEPVLEDLFNLELTSGRLPPPPESLKGKQLRIDMVSPLQQMQQRFLKLGSGRQALQEIFAIGSAKPDILDNFDLDVYSRNIAEAHGMDKRVVREALEVEKLRQARAKAQSDMLNQQMAMEQAKVGAEVVSKAPQLMGGRQ